MFRFTIRDLLWLTVVVALAVAWWISDWRRHKVAADQQQQIDKLSQEVESLSRWFRFGLGTKEYTGSGKPKYWMHDHLAPVPRD